MDLHYFKRLDLNLNESQNSRASEARSLAVDAEKEKENAKMSCFEKLDVLSGGLEAFFGACKSFIFW
jgi:hypothetical protein